MIDVPLRLTLDGAALAANWRWFAARSGRAACGAAVKADGYGLGARDVVPRLAAAGCRDFFVTTWAEAAALGRAGDGVSLSILHGVREADLAQALASSARPVLNSPAMVARWKAAAPHRACDVMVDTGMNRLGLTPAEAGSGMLDGLRIATLMSHLACADEPGHPLNDTQRARFAALVAAVPADRYSLANSAGICLGEPYAFDLTRPGLGLYGGVPAPGADGQIVPVVALEAEVLQVRDVAAGEAVGYGATFVAPAAIRAAILNIGYADGYFRALGPGGAAWAGERRCPVIGRVSMDLIAVDVTGGDVSEGDWLSIDLDLPNAVSGTSLSQYELLTGLGHRYQRRWT
ncbi:MAG: alanine racemase [Sphingomonas bacterium]|nr:alanine racemase [Sphingomonas bacterium]